MLTTELYRTELLLKRCPLSFTGFPCIKRMFPLQREKVNTPTYSHSLFPADHVPGELVQLITGGTVGQVGSSRSSIQRLPSMTVATHTEMIRNTEEPSGLQLSMGIPGLTPGTFCLPSGLLGMLRHLHFSY